MEVQNIDVQTAKKWLDNNEAILIDVREAAEHAAEKIAGAVLHPVGSICCRTIPQTAKKILIHCQKGGRSNKACQKLIAEDSALKVYNITGGIEAWQQAGFPVQRAVKKIVPLDR